MATKPRSKKSAAALQHPIRIVPLHRPEAQRIAAAATPQLTYRGGPLLTAVEVFTVFWGTEWKQAEQSAIATNMNLFFDYILTSALMSQLGEYSVPGKNIGHGKRTGTATLTSPGSPSFAASGPARIRRTGMRSSARRQIGPVQSSRSESPSAAGN